MESLRFRRCVFVICSLLTTTIWCLPVGDIGELDVYKYLTKYGYIIEPVSSSKTKPEILKDGIIKFQTYHDIKPTGEVDEETLKWISTPRCGIPDRVPLTLEETTTSASRLPRPAEYRVFAAKWPSTRLKWHISGYTNQIPQGQQRSTIKKALDVWSEVSQLQFEEQRENVDIDIKFVTREHGDDSPFDGPTRGRIGSVLAHAFPPGSSDLSGDAHFDNDEQWTADVTSTDKTKKFLELIAAHEFGHSLGLDHSRINSALMSAYYVNSQREYELHDDDIAAIQYLYGAPNGWKPRTTPKPTTPPPIPICHRLFNAVVWGPDKRPYGIYNDKVIELADKRNVFSIPRSLQDLFPGSPIGVDFAVTYPDGSITYMFRGGNVWKFNGYTLDPQFPTMFNYRDLPEHPIGVFSMTDMGKFVIYMFGMTSFWRWEPESMYSGRSYPYYSSQAYWGHNPARYGLVTTWIDGTVYFIKYNSHSIIKDKTIVDGYPKEGVPVWVDNGCRSGSSMITYHLGNLLLLLVITAKLIL